MFLTRCPFCTHANPAGSRFCNACGAPLHLRPCPHCEAVNDVAARACHRCGATLDVGRDAAQAQSAAHGAELAELEVALARMSVDDGVRRASLPARATQGSRPRDDRATAVPERDRDAIADSPAEPRVTSLPLVIEAASDRRGPMARRDAPRSRVPALGALVVVGLAAIAAYAWWRGALVFDAATPARVIQAPVIVPAPPAADDGTATPGTPATAQPAAAAAPTNDAATTPTPPAAIAPSPDARPSPAAAPPRAKGSSQDAIATERVIRRALGGLASPPPPR